MSTFCLVHGSSQGPRGWDRLVPALEALGHQCVCVDLPTDRPGMGAAGYAAIVAESLDGAAAAHPIVVVAHSVSGLFLPLVPQSASVAGLVYLAAVIPQPGESFISQYRKDPAMYRPDFVGKDPAVDESLALQFLFHDCAPDLARWGLTTVRPMYAKQALLEECPLAALPTVPSAYISCRQDRTINPDWWEAAALERLHVEPIAIEAGHSPHVSRASLLATLLDAFPGSLQQDGAAAGA